MQPQQSSRIDLVDLKAQIAKKFGVNKITSGPLSGLVGRNPNLVELEDKLLAMQQPESKTREPPLLIQFRLFNNGCAVKGTLLVNKKLPPRTIQVRPSMIKVETDPKLLNIRTENSLEIVGTR
uniref:RNA-dependent RNA polymerase n=1 Tax=Fagus sylvatica TaxID=28930 RepID=A0A2N9ISU0_FAGSY